MAITAQNSSNEIQKSCYFAHETAVIDQGAQIGKGSKIWHFSHVMDKAVIGNNCVLGQNVMIAAHVVIGDNCKIQNNVSLYEGVELEEGVFCGPSSVFTNVKNPRAEISRKNEFRKTLIRKGATIGANATILNGIELGAYCFIGAGATVTKDVPAHALMVGTPAKIKGWVSHAGEILKEDLKCPRTGQKYYLKDELTLETIK